MVQKAARRGRPPEFDRDAVVTEAIGAFFRSGYGGTTLADLERATGVDRSTLYNSFGGKHGLYEMATSAYLDNAERSLFEPLHDRKQDGYGAILEFLARLRAGLTAPEAVPGCLIVNDMAAGSAPVAAERYRRHLEFGLVAALSRADHPDAEAYAGLLATAVLGVNLVSKTTGDPVEIERLVEAMIATVDAWRQTEA